MQARATFASQSSTRGLVVFVVAILAALLVGGAGGYAVRAVTSSVSAATPTVVHRPFVVEQPPYSSPAPKPTIAPILDPNGNPIPV